MIALTWDPTVNAGAVIAMLGIIVTIILAMVPVLINIGRARGELSDVRTDIAEMKPKVDLILSVQTQQASDSKRIDRVEARIDRLAGGKA